MNESHRNASTINDRLSLYEMLETAANDARCRIPHAIRPTIVQPTYATHLDTDVPVQTILKHGTNSWGANSMFFFARAERTKSETQFRITTGLHVRERALIGLNAAEMVSRVRLWAKTMESGGEFTRKILGRESHAWANTAWQTGDGVFGRDEIHEYEVAHTSLVTSNEMGTTVRNVLTYVFEIVGHESGMTQSLPGKLVLARPSKRELVVKPGAGTGAKTTTKESRGWLQAIIKALGQLIRHARLRSI